MGAYPDSQFHLFPLLLQDYRTLVLHINTSYFPPLAFKRFMDVCTSESAKKDPSHLTFPSSLPILYTQFLSSSLPQNRDSLDVSPLEYYLIRFLTCLFSLPAPPTPSDPLHLNRIPAGTTLPVQLFTQYLRFLTHIPPHPPVCPSLQRPDRFFLAAIAALWLDRDDHLPRDYPTLLAECSRQSLSVAIHFPANCRPFPALRSSC